MIINNRYCLTQMELTIKAFSSYTTVQKFGVSKILFCQKKKTNWFLKNDSKDISIKLQKMSVSNKYSLNNLKKCITFSTKLLITVFINHCTLKTVTVFNIEYKLLENQISISDSEWFLKDHVILKTEIIFIFLYIFSPQINAAFVRHFVPSSNFWMLVYIISIWTFPEVPCFKPNLKINLSKIQQICW